MKKLVFFCAIVCVACNRLTPSDIAEDETLLNIQSKSIFACANSICRDVSGQEVWKDIRIEQWNSTPVDTMTQYDIYVINELNASLNYTDVVFEQVEPKYEYEWALNHPYNYTQQQIMDLERKVIRLQVKDSILSAESKKWKKLVENKDGVETPVYYIYHFVAGATNIKSGEDSYLDFGYSFYNVESGHIDTTIMIGDEISTYLNSQNGVELRKNLPIVTKGIAGLDRVISEEARSKMLKTNSQQAQNIRQPKLSGDEYLMENSKREGVKVTTSGLQYEVLKMGKGKRPNINNQVKVHYVGTLIDGTVFDSSIDRGEPITFYLNQVIDGWKEGVQLMPAGSKFRFVIPPHLGYGENACGSIPPHSVLIFEVELLSVK